MTTGDVERSIEVERKYDVDDATPIPDWTALPGVSRVGDAEPRELDARYFDTADAALSRARTALRRRTGGPDAGWHIKRAIPQGKHETRFPLDPGGDQPHSVGPEVPDAVATALAGLAAPPFTPIAHIRNARTAYALVDDQGGLVAEFVDDRVTATDLLRGVESTWREWEVELGPAAPVDDAGRAALFSCVDDIVIAVGGAVSGSESKLGRALGVSG